jgi:hypothetical protein
MPNLVETTLKIGQDFCLFSDEASADGFLSTEVGKYEF